MKEKDVSMVICPVCKKEGNREHIIRHMMNSYGEKKHNIFISQQDEKIRDIYRNIKDEDLNPHKISQDLFCSASHIRKIFSEFSDYKQRIVSKKSFDVSKQYVDKIRKKPNSFNNNWKLSRENGGKRFINEKQIDKIYELYNTKMTQKDIAKNVSCKEETIRKYLVSRFGEKDVAERNKKAKSLKISKLNIDIKINLRSHFFNGSTKKKISEELQLSISTVLSYYRKTFSKQQRETRIKKLNKNSILKSLIVCGKSGITGSKPENMCYNLIKDNIENVIHHDMNICEPYEIDITIPDYKIAVFWDGPFHRRPIFGEKNLQLVQKRDVIKKNKLCSVGWKIIIVNDDHSKLNVECIKKTADAIIKLLSKNFNIITITN
jgi:AraC-like DNA-binding protein